jgi:hypothetical protein
VGVSMAYRWKALNVQHDGSGAGRKTLLIFPGQG